jgi:hypothetical protein
MTKDGMDYLGDDSSPFKRERSPNGSDGGVASKSLAVTEVEGGVVCVSARILWIKLRFL